MNRTTLKIVLCLVLFAGIAILAGSATHPAQFDVISGAEWSQRAARALPHVQATPPLSATQAASPRIASSLILLAGGLILTVMALALHARSQAERLSFSPLRTP